MLPTFRTILAPEVPTSSAVLDDQAPFAVERYHEPPFLEGRSRVIVGMSNGPIYTLAAVTSKARHGIYVNG